MTFERRRPPLEMKPAQQALAKHAQTIYAEIGRTLIVGQIAEGGGTDAAFAALKQHGTGDRKVRRARLAFQQCGVY